MHQCYSVSRQSCSPDSTIKADIKLQKGTMMGIENIKDSLFDVRKKQKIKLQVGNKVLTLAKADQRDKPYILYRK